MNVGSFVECFSIHAKVRKEFIVLKRSPIAANKNIYFIATQGLRILLERFPVFARSACRKMMYPAPINPTIQKEQSEKAKSILPDSVLLLCRLLGRAHVSLGGYAPQPPDISYPQHDPGERGKRTHQFHRHRLLYADPRFWLVVDLYHQRHHRPDEF
jgi:hypothetical protein